MRPQPGLVANRLAMRDPAPHGIGHHAPGSVAQRGDGNRRPQLLRVQADHRKQHHLRSNRDQRGGEETAGQKRPETGISGKKGLEGFDQGQRSAKVETPCLGVLFV